MQPPTWALVATYTGRLQPSAEVTTFAAPAVLVIAHNAAFDRRLLERYSPFE